MEIIVLKRVVLLFICLLVFTVSAYALRCGRELVEIGDSTHEVLRKCGNPSHTEEVIKYTYMYQENYIYNYRERDDRWIRVPYHVGEKWTYNFGRQRLMRELYFVNERLQRIETLGYGY